MSPTAVLILRIVILAEPFYTLGTLLIWVSAGRRHSGIASMRNYLAVRVVNTTISISLLFGMRLTHLTATEWRWTYICSYWVGYLILVGIQLQVAGLVLQSVLRKLPGLQALAKGTFRWLVFAAFLLVLPVAVSLAIVFNAHDAVPVALFRFISTIAIAQLLPLVFVMAVAISFGFRLRSREIGLLAAFCLEPAVDLATSWFRVTGVLIWTNVVHEIASYAALTLWMLCAVLPRREDPLPPPNESLLLRDQMLRKALRRRLRVAEPEPELAQGGRPWPSDREL
jgi:hypothetical protein